VPVVTGVIFVLIILIFRRGIVGEFAYHWHRLRGRTA
jgi:hypothetical protein